MSAKQSTNRVIRPCTLVYVVLIVLTVVTWAIGRSELSGFWLALLVLTFALVKGQLVGDWFMGLREVRGIWRWVIVIWLLIPGGLITWAFALSYGS
jgi:caa(3)-type oxidase subunit IV